jgi:ATP-binding cassette subfamily B protein
MSREWLQDARRFVWHYTSARRFEFWSLFAAVFTGAALSVAMQYQLKRLVDALSSASRSNAVWQALALFAALMAIESALLRFSAWLACRATIGVGVKIRSDLFDELAAQSIRYFIDNRAGSLGQRMTGTAGAFGALVNTVAWRILPLIVDFVGAVVIFTLIDGAMAAALGSYVALSTAALIAAGRKGRGLHNAYFARAGAVAGELIDVVCNMWAVQAFAAQDREGRRLRVEFEREARVQQKSWMYTEKLRIVFDLVVWIMAVVSWVWAVRAWTVHAITPGDLVVVITLTLRILHGSRDVALALIDASLHVGYIEETLQVIRAIPKPLEVPARARRQGRRAGQIAFDDVTFGYDPARPVLRRISLQVKSGEKVGIVGPSGAGKTTIIQLMQRLFDPDSGHIALDGVPIRAYPPEGLQTALAVVPQEIVLFHRSIIENIRFGRPAATDAEVYSAARAAHCEEFVLALPDGYATMVGERGMKLSGGQRQRIGLARAFLKQASILILDEATAALDTASELFIQQSITRGFHGRTVIAIAHRLSTLAAYDRIVVIDRGRIVEQGRPAELRDRGQVFRSMWQLQAHGLLSEAEAAISGPCYSAASGRIPS